MQCFYRYLLVVCQMTCFIALSNQVYAHSSVIKMGAAIEVLAGYYKTNGDTTQQKFTKYNNYYGLNSGGHFLFDYQFISDSKIKYGAKISIQQTSKNNRTAPLSLYIESQYGKLEGGSDKSAFAKMMITGYTTSCAVGNSWDVYIIPSPRLKTKGPQVDYVTNFSNFLDSKTRTSGHTDFSRKITYFTPKVGSKQHNVQLGISYIPDTSNAGHDNINAMHAQPVAGGHRYAFKDGLSYGIVYANNFAEPLMVKLALTGETGTVVAFDRKTNVRSSEKFKKLNTYNIGTEITYNRFSISASYMDHNKSITNTKTTVAEFGRDTSIYSIGARYKIKDSKLAFSINHFQSTHKKNKLYAESLGMDYNITSGIKGYAQVTYTHSDGKYIENNIIKIDKSKGGIILVGGKIAL